MYLSESGRSYCGLTSVLYCVLVFSSEKWYNLFSVPFKFGASLHEIRTANVGVDSQ
jgi:hypothetical protein